VQEVSYFVEFEEVYFLRIVWNHVRTCSVQTRLLVDPTKIEVILELEPPTSVKKLRAMLGRTGYYRKFINGYAQITTLMEKLLNKEAEFERNEDF
jgi:hypothetical protein